jgi:glycosyltransferase involved in cell wall biosynthesis
MCVNRHSEHLGAAIESVLVQSCGDFLFYVIANDCDDELWSFLHVFKDDRVRLHRTSVGQLAFNLNYGLNLIGGGYALRIDSDDLCLPDRLKLTRDGLEALRYPDVLGGEAIVINEAGQEIGYQHVPHSNSAIRSKLWRSCPMIHPTCAINVKSVLRLRGYLGGFMSEDYDLWIRAARQPDFRFANLDCPLIRYRISPGQSRGRPLGYSEVAGHMLREGLLQSNIKYLAGTILAASKRYFFAR